MIISLPQNLNEGRILLFSFAARAQTIGDSAASTFTFEVRLDDVPVSGPYGLTAEEMAIFDGNGRSDAESQRKQAPHPASPRKRKSRIGNPMDDEVLE